MMHSVPQPGLTVLAVAGQLERGVRHRLAQAGNRETNLRRTAFLRLRGDH